VNRRQTLVLKVFLSIQLLSLNFILAQHDSSSNKEKIVKTIIPQSNRYEFDEVEQALNSDLVVIGTVKHMKDTPAKTSEMFHSMVIIHIDSVLRGETNFENLTIRLQSGPVTDDIHGGDRIKDCNEPNFKIGQRIVLFLKNAINDPYLNSGYAKENFKSFGTKNNLSDLPKNTFWVSNNRVFEIKNGMVSYFGKTIKEDDFIRKIVK